MAKEAHILGMPAWIVFIILLVFLSAPSGFFLYSSYKRLETILGDIKDSPDKGSPLVNLDLESDELELEARIALEYQTILNRQHRSQVSLATRTWLRFMSLMFGAILIIIGAAFVLGRITSPQSEGKLSINEFSVSLVASSPGLFLIAFGTLLVAIPNVTKQPISTSDGYVYLGRPVSRLPAPIEDIEPPIPNIQERDRAVDHILQELKGEDNEPKN